jgi:Domain of unknown function (DUF4386)
MYNTKAIGWLLIIGSLNVMIPYTVLTFMFDYPGILRESPGTILKKFHEGNGKLIFTWWCFAMSAIPLLIAFYKIGDRPEMKRMKWVTSFGVIAAMLQMIGLLRWVFIIPVLATKYVKAEDESTKNLATSGFELIHQFGGVLMGEHLGQLFTIIWTVSVSIQFLRSNLLARWKSWFGISSSFIYLLAQAELFNTVLPGILIWDSAGLIGSTLWLIWLLLIGISFLFLKKSARSM